MSHGDHKSHKAVVDLVKEYNKLNRNNVAIMLDTKGPEVRSGDVTEPIDMKPGMTLHYSCVINIIAACHAYHSAWPGLMRICARIDCLLPMMCVHVG